MAATKVASLSELTDNIPHKVEIGDLPLTIIKIDDEVFAIHDTCSHQDYSLAEGMVFDCQIECALHGSMFDLRTGKPNALPATTPVPVYATEIDGDAVLVDPDDQLNDAPVPDHW